MRVISGKARGVQLRSPSTEETRPITDRAKEALFNILAPVIPDCRFLDLFAGTGGVCIEALSRGAAQATFLEISRPIYADLLWNIGRARVQSGADARNGDAFLFLKEERRLTFDIIFVAPPQWKNMCQQAMDALTQNLHLLAKGGIVITQHDPAETVNADPAALTEYDKRIYGGVQFNFFRRPELED